MHWRMNGIPVNDFIGNAIVENEPMKPKQARLIGQLLNMTAYYGLNNLPAKFYLLALRLMVCYHMKPKDAVALYTRYVGDWGRLPRSISLRLSGTEKW